jgi:hypothetical protein
MTMNWSQTQWDASTKLERETACRSRLPSETPIPIPTPHIDSRLTNRVEVEAPTAPGFPLWKTRFSGWDVMLAAVLGVVLFVLMNVASFGLLGSAVTVVGILAAVGLGHYVLWGRVFAWGVVRETQGVQDHPRKNRIMASRAGDE